jgi:hypothetical protein
MNGASAKIIPSSGKPQATSNQEPATAAKTARGNDPVTHGIASVTMPLRIGEGALS